MMDSLRCRRRRQKDSIGYGGRRAGWCREWTWGWRGVGGGGGPARLYVRPSGGRAGTLVGEERAKQFPKDDQRAANTATKNSLNFPSSHRYTLQLTLLTLLPAPPCSTWEHRLQCGAT